MPQQGLCAWAAAELPSSKTGGKGAEHRAEHIEAFSWLNPFSKAQPVRNGRMKTEVQHRLPKPATSLHEKVWLVSKQYV